MYNGKLIPNTNIIVGNGIKAIPVDNVNSNMDEYGNSVYQNRGDGYILLELGQNDYNDTMVGSNKLVEVTFNRNDYGASSNDVLNRLDTVEQKANEVLSLFQILTSSIETNPTVKECWNQMMNVMKINGDNSAYIKELERKIEGKTDPDDSPF